MLAVFLTGMMIAPLAIAAKFTILVFPDTQTEMTEALTYGAMKKWPAMVNWVVANRVSKNIQFICHVGDLVDWETPNSTPPNFMYQAGSDGFAVIDAAGMHYCIAVGNHDTRAVGGINGDGTACWCSGSAGPGDVHANLRNTTTLNTFFPPARYTACRGRYESTKTDNAYHTFSAGGLDWLVINTELDPRQGALDWFNSVISAHPTHNVIYVTHNYLSGSGTTGGGCGYGDLAPQQVWDGCLKLHSNVKLVLCGHVCCNARRINTGTSGNKVYEMLTDWQDEGNGWLRTLEIDPDSGTIMAKTYSPYLNQYKSDSANDFRLTGISFVPAAPPTGVRGGPPLFSLAKNPEGMENSVLNIYTLSGRRVYSMTTKRRVAGWDNRNAAALGIKPGNYVYVIADINGNRKSGKMAITSLTP